MIRSLSLALLASLLPAQTVKTIVKNGATSNRYDIVILGDGYQASEQAKFDANCQAVVNRLFATEPYKTVKQFFNVHTVFRASKDSGADHPDRSPPIVKDTVYDASYNTGGTARCLYIKNGSQALRDAALAPAVEGRVMVIVNDSRYGGCAGTFAVTYNGSSMAVVQVHEFGHSFAGLADEYDYPNNRYSGPEPRQKNVTISSTGAKWKHWHGTGGISAFEGARYYRYGIYRPARNCIMRSLGAGHCAVCAEEVVLKAYSYVNTIENPLPTASRISVKPGTKQAFSFTHLAPSPATATVVWSLDGKALANASGSSTVIDTSKLPFGDHQVRVEVRDNTPFVRLDPSALLRRSHTWTLHVQPPPIPDYQLMYGAATITSVAAGTDLTLAAVVQNIGGINAPATKVEQFLSSDQVLQPSDVYLGGYDLPALVPYQPNSKVRPGVRVPAHLTPGTWYLGTIVNRSGSVTEISSSNNLRWQTITITKPACGPALEYANPLNYPQDQASLQAKAGGTLDLLITAPCHAGYGYLVLLGCTGTQPGTGLGNNLHLPLNVDACSSVFFANANTAVTPGFLGTLDAQGLGRARLILPGGALKQGFRGHFAALLYDSKTGSFAATSQAVSVEIKP